MTNRWDVPCTCGHSRPAHGSSGSRLCYHFFSDTGTPADKYCPCDQYIAAVYIIREEDDWDALVS